MEREKDVLPCMCICMCHGVRMSCHACAMPCMHTTRPGPGCQPDIGFTLRSAHTAVHTPQIFTLLFGLFLLLFWSTMFIAYPRAGGTQLELVPCKSRAHCTYYGSIYYDNTHYTSYLRL